MSFHSDDIAKLILRLMIGWVMLPYGIDYAKDGLDFIFEVLKTNGLPSFLAYGVLLGELVGPILVLIGWWSRIGGALIFGTMLLSILLAHRDIMFEYNEFGGWSIALNALLSFGGLAIFFAGAGKYSLSRGKGKWD
ncbi:MAG: DoxX family protein [Saprospiraceae bacterium]